MMKRLTSVIVALLLALPTVGCAQKEEKNDNKVLEVQVDVGKTKVSVEGSTKPDEKGRHLDVQVERQSEHETGERGK